MSGADTNPTFPLEKMALSALGWVAQLSSGDRAELRGSGFGGSFWRVFHGSGLAESAYGEDASRDLVQMLAILIGTSEQAQLHNPKVGFGVAVCQAGITPQTVERILSADAPMRRAMLIRQCRRLARSGGSFDVRDLARLVLTPSSETTARKVARDYYGEKSRQDAKTAKE